MDVHCHEVLGGSEPSSPVLNEVEVGNHDYDWSYVELGGQTSMLESDYNNNIASSLDNNSCSSGFHSSQNSELFDSDHSYVLSNCSAFITPPPSPPKAISNGLVSSDYTPCIVTYLKGLEQQYFFVLQKPIMAFEADGSPKKPVTQKTREIVVDWLIQVQDYLKFEVESLMMGIAMMDLYYRYECPAMENVQLVAITCMLIATKYLEEEPAQIKQLINLTEDSYTKAEVVQMEMKLLEFFNFMLVFATPYSFRWMYSEFDKPIQFTVDYLIELVMKEPLYTDCLASQLVASCIYAAHLLHYPDNLSLAVQLQDQLPGYRIGELFDIISRIFDYLMGASRGGNACQKGAREKYASERFLMISRNPLVERPNLDFLTEFCT